MTSTATRKLVVLDPTAPPREIWEAMAPRLPDLRGRAVGFLWNRKPNGDILFGRLEELLREKYEISSATYRSKPTASVGATEKVLEELAASTEAVIVGLAD